MTQLAPSHYTLSQRIEHCKDLALVAAFNQCRNLIPQHTERTYLDFYTNCYVAEYRYQATRNNVPIRKVG